MGLWRLDTRRGAPENRDGGGRDRNSMKGRAMLISTTTAIEGRPVAQYLGVVAGETILGANIFRDIGAQFRNITGGRATGYEKELRRGREEAMGEMQQEATALGADAIIGIDIDYETVGGSMLMVTVSGTAVKLG
jgi:uncharacterized protein YbjQ (UPF0145 family)